MQVVDWMGVPGRDTWWRCHIESGIVAYSQQSASKKRKHPSQPSLGTSIDHSHGPCLTPSFSRFPLCCCNVWCICLLVPLLRGLVHHDPCLEVRPELLTPISVEEVEVLLVHLSTLVLDPLGCIAYKLNYSIIAVTSTAFALID